MFYTTWALTTQVLIYVDSAASMYIHILLQLPGLYVSQIKRKKGEVYGQHTLTITKLLTDLDLWEVVNTIDHHRFVIIEQYTYRYLVDVMYTEQLVNKINSVLND